MSVGKSPSHASFLLSADQVTSRAASFWSGAMRRASPPVSDSTDSCSVDDVSDALSVGRDGNLVNLLDGGKGIERCRNAILRNRAAAEGAQQKGEEKFSASHRRRVYTSDFCAVSTAYVRTLDVNLRLNSDYDRSRVRTSTATGEGARATRTPVSAQITDTNLGHRLAMGYPPSPWSCGINRLRAREGQNLNICKELIGKIFRTKDLGFRRSLLWSCSPSRAIYI